MGGGGYGDPLDRDPEAVARDLRHGLVTHVPARDIYGVVVDPTTGQVDATATEQRRLELRGERLGRPVAGPLRRRAQRQALRISEYLDRKEDGSTACSWCGESFAPPGAEWQEHAAAQRVPISAGGPGRPDSGGFVLFQLGIDAAPLYDRVLRWPDEER
jgi:N-methylhydantoinase B